MWSWLLAVLLAVGTALPPPTVETGRHERVRETLVPAVRTLDLASARRAVRQAGLSLRIREVMGTACRPEREVLAQRPSPNAKLPTGSWVTIEVNTGAMGRCGLRLPPTTPALSRTAARFVDFARSQADAPPADTPIALYLGGARVTEGLPDAPRANWQLCPEGGSYAARVCPFSALEPLARHAGPLAFTSRPPEHPCAHPARVAGAPYSVTITPDENQACTSYWAVQLIVNNVQQVTAVNLVWSEP